MPFPVNRMEDLGLDTTRYVEIMADGLAIMHWVAKVDANDVEFVLAPGRSDHQGAPLLYSPELGEHTLWLLNFDICREMSMDGAGINQAVLSFYRNDPYYTRPISIHKEDQMLWQVFRDRFLKTSQQILGDHHELATQSMDEIERIGAGMRTRRRLDDILQSRDELRG